MAPQTKDLLLYGSSIFGAAFVIVPLIAAGIILLFSAWAVIMSISVYFRIVAFFYPTKQ